MRGRPIHSTETTDDEVLTPLKLAKMLGIGLDTALKLLSSGELPSWKPGKKPLTTRRAVLHKIDGLGKEEKK